jgi:hypothetical protein
VVPVALLRRLVQPVGHGGGRIAGYAFAFVRGRGDDGVFGGLGADSGGGGMAVVLGHAGDGLCLKRGIDSRVTGGVWLTGASRDRVYLGLLADRFGLRKTERERKRNS